MGERDKKSPTSEDITRLTTDEYVAELARAAASAKRAEERARRALAGEPDDDGEPDGEEQQP